MQEHMPDRSLAGHPFGLGLNLVVLAALVTAAADPARACNVCPIPGIDNECDPDCYPTYNQTEPPCCTECLSEAVTGPSGLVACDELVTLTVRGPLSWECTSGIPGYPDCEVEYILTTNGQIAELWPLGKPQPPDRVQQLCFSDRCADGQFHPPSAFCDTNGQIEVFSPTCNWCENACVWQSSQLETYTCGCLREMTLDARSAYLKLGVGQTQDVHVYATQCGLTVLLQSRWCGEGGVAFADQHYAWPGKGRLLGMNIAPPSINACEPSTTVGVTHCSPVFCQGDPQVMNNPHIQWTTSPSEGIRVQPLGMFACEVILEDRSKIKTKSIKVTATPDNPSYWCAKSVTGIIDLAGGCTATSCSLTSEGEADNGCVNVRISLGRDSLGGSAGYLYLLKDEPTAPIAIAASQLTYHVPSSSPIVDADRGGMDIKQIKVPDALVEIVATNLDSGPFTVDFYTNQAAGTPSNGVYTPSSGTHYRQWKFESPSSNVILVNDNYKANYGNDDIALKSEYTYGTEAGGTGWVMRQSDWDDNPLRTIKHLTDGNARTYQVLDAAETTTVESTRKVYDGSGNVTQSTVYADASTAVVTDYRWLQGLLRQVTDTSGKWEVNQYNSSGKKVLTVSSYLDAPKPALPEPEYDSPTGAVDDSRGHAFLYAYTLPGSDDDPSIQSDKPRVITEKINNEVVSKSYHIYYNTSIYTVAISEQDYAPTDASEFPDSGNLRTEIRSYLATDPASYRAGRPYLVYHPDGTWEEYEYAQGDYDPGDNHTPGTLEGSGEFIKTTVKRYGALGREAWKSTTSVTITDQAGRVVQEETRVFTGSTDELIAWTVRDYDLQGRPLGTYSSNNETETTTYDSAACCGNWMTTGSDGVKTAYKLDGLRRVYQQIKKGYPVDDEGEIITEYEFDAAGRTTKTTTRNAASTVSIATQTRYDWLGRPIVSTDAAGIHTGYLYEDLLCDGVPCGRKTTVSRYGDVNQQTGVFVPVTGVTVTEISEYHPGGQIKSVTGTGTIEKHYDYGVYTLTTAVWWDGGSEPVEIPCRWTQVVTGGSDPASSPWTKTWTGPLGQTIRDDRPAYVPPEASNPPEELWTWHVYNYKGQMVCEVHEADNATKYSADTLYEYDSLGNQIRSGMDLNGTVGLQSTAAPPDPPGQHADRIQETDTRYVNDSGWWEVTTTKTYARDDNAIATQIGTHKRRLTGFASSDIIEESISTDIYDNQTIATTTVTPANKRVTQTVNLPDSGTDAISVTENGLLKSITSSSGVGTTFAYDAIGRRTNVKEARHTNANGTVTAYDPDTGQVTSVTDPANNVITYAYYPYTGRLKSVTRTVGSPPVDVIQYLAYDDQGRQTHVWGNGTYPVKYGYDEYGRRETMTTYRSPANVDFTTATWPANAPVDGEHVEITTWGYDDATGLLESKTDDADKVVTYTYTPEGKLETRTWARAVDTNKVLVTQHVYDADTGELTSVNYWRDDPTTPEFDAADPDTPSVTFTYTRLGEQKTVTQTGIATWTFDYDDDDTEIPITNRLHVLSEAITGTGGFYSKTITRDYDGIGRDAGFHIASEYDVDYHYNTTDGRFERITGPGLPGYVSLGQPGYGVEYSRLADSDLIEYGLYKSDSSTTVASSRRHYEPNRDLIDYVENSMTASPPGVVSKYGYTNDTLGRRTQVTMTGAAFYDPMSEGQADVHAYNTRSELTSTNRREWSELGLLGSELETNYEYSYDYDNIGNRLSHDVDREDPPPAISYTANDLNQYTNQSQSFDDDGNQTGDGLYEYFWDAENRLIRIATPLSQGQPGVYDVGDDKVEYKYDYMGRRVEQKILTCTAGGQNPTWQATGLGWLRFVYDGWNLVMVLNGSDNSLNRTYTWGLDLSGTIHGAGGIGGLLAQSGSYWFFFDANGNVGQVMQGTTIAAKYVYDPYGNIIEMGGEGGAFPGDNPIRFSTKWFDTDFAPGDSSLGYWDKRYYDAKRGRWTSEDPAEEQGGPNLYGYVDNSPSNTVDPDGRWIIGLHGANNKGYGAWSQTLKDLREVEVAWYKAHSCVQGVDSPGHLDEIGAPTGFPFGTVLPDWQGAVDSLRRHIQDYMLYYNAWKAGKYGCGCPEYLHVVGFSDGATTIALYMNHVLPTTVLFPDCTEAYGMAGIVDMVRPSRHVDPFGDLPNGNTGKFYGVTQGPFAQTTSLRNKSPLFSLTPNWTGIGVGWGDLWVTGSSNPRIGHLDVPGKQSVKDELKSKLLESLKSRSKQCECSSQISGE